MGVLLEPRQLNKGHSYILVTPFRSLHLSISIFSLASLAEVVYKNAILPLSFIHNSKSRGFYHLQVRPALSIKS